MISRQYAVGSRQYAGARLLPTVYCLLPTVYCLLPTVCCLLLVFAASPALAGDRPLIHAVKTGNVQAVQALIKQRANVNEQQPDGATALHWAADAEDAR